jgi:hypothetical protein
MYLERLWLFGNLMHGMCKVFNILWCNSSHGNSAIFGQVNAIILCETFSLKNNPAISTFKLNRQLCNATNQLLKVYVKKSVHLQLIYNLHNLKWQSSLETNNSASWEIPYILQSLKSHMPIIRIHH